MDNQRPPNTPTRPPGLLRKYAQSSSAKDTPPSHAQVNNAINRNAQHSAAFELAETYDPVAMKKFGATSVAADPALAQYWYQRARAGKLPAAGQEPEAIASRATAGSN